MEDIEQDIPYFLSLSQEVLLHELFPRLDISQINRLCLTNTYFNDICNNETLWQIKLNNEYSDIYSYKPENISYREYYKILYTSKLIPVYYNGDIIEYVHYNRNLLDLIINELKSNIDDITKLNNNNKLSILFIKINNNQESTDYERTATDYERTANKLIYDPIFVIDYPLLTTHIISNNYDDVMRIILTLESNLVQPQRINKGRKRTINNKTTINKQNISIIKSIIYRELTSHNSAIPIYGLVDNNEFKIIDNRNINFNRDLRIVENPKLCRSITANDRTNILIRIYQSTDRNIADISNYKNTNLCQIIQKELKDIGHIINE